MNNIQNEVSTPADALKVCNQIKNGQTINVTTVNKAIDILAHSKYKKSQLFEWTATTSATITILLMVCAIPKVKFEEVFFGSMIAAGFATTFVQRSAISSFKKEIELSLESKV